MAKDKNRGNFTGRNQNNQPSNPAMNNENTGTNSDQTAVDSGAAAGTAGQPGTEALQSSADLGAGAAGAKEGVQSSSDAGEASGASGDAVSAGVQGAGANDAPAVGGVPAAPVVSGPVVSEAELAAEAVVRQAYEQPRGAASTKTEDLKAPQARPLEQMAAFQADVAAQVYDSSAVFVEVTGPAVSQFAKGLLEEFHNYVEAMDPKRPIAQVAGAAHQRRLFTILRSIINSLEGDDFQVVFGQVLSTFEAQAKGVFHDLSVFRFFDARELNLTTPDRLAFRNLVSFLIKIAPVKSRHLVAQQVNMDAHFGHAAFTEEGRQRVQNFCNIR